jgi:peptidyl-prolyl cis-trans isomerase C
MISNFHFDHKEFSMNPLFVTAGLILLSFSLQAAEPDQESEILATRGKGVVTQGVFSARAEKIPAEARLATLRDGNRLEDVIYDLLLNSQLAADAREAGFDKESHIQARMQLAAETELSAAWLQNYKETRPVADYEQMAREYYQINKKKIVTSRKVDVSHILISTKERSPEEALVLATSLREQLQSDPSLFDEMITEYSEDPSAASNQGRFFAVKPGAMVKPFEDTAFTLDEGEISEPVKTQYGYHIIRLDAKIAPQQMSFEDVKERLIANQKKQHIDRIILNYLDGFASQDVEISQEALELLVDRLFGEDYVDPYTNGGAK